MPKSEELSEKELRYLQSISRNDVNSFLPLDKTMDVLNFLWLL